MRGESYSKQLKQLKQLIAAGGLVPSVDGTARVNPVCNYRQAHSGRARVCGKDGASWTIRGGPIYCNQRNVDFEVPFLKHPRFCSAEQQ